MDKIEESCLMQAYNLSNLPFVHKWVCLMPDTHAGMGMPIGGVIAAKDVVIPNAVGVDIGCGMVFMATDVRYEEIKDVSVGTSTIMQSMIGSIMRSVPVGFDKHKKKQESAVKKFPGFPLPSRFRRQRAFLSPTEGSLQALRW